MAFGTSIMQGRVAARVTPVNVESSFSEEYLYDRFLPITAGVEKSYAVVHMLNVLKQEFNHIIILVGCGDIQGA